MIKNLKNILIITILSIVLILFGTKVYATTGKTLNNSTRIRKKADTSSDIVEEVTKNEEVEVVSKEGNWYKVKYRTSKETVEGYIREDLLEVKEEVATSNNNNKNDKESTENKDNNENDKKDENTENKENETNKETTQTEEIEVAYKMTN